MVRIFIALFYVMKLNLSLSLSIEFYSIRLSFLNLLYIFILHSVLVLYNTFPYLMNQVLLLSIPIFIVSLSMMRIQARVAKEESGFLSCTVRVFF